MCVGQQTCRVCLSLELNQVTVAVLSVLSRTIQRRYDYSQSDLIGHPVLRARASVSRPVRKGESGLTVDIDRRLRSRLWYTGISWH